MTLVYGLMFPLVAAALAYQLRLCQATVHIGRTLSPGSRTGVQDAITPPESAYVSLGIYGSALLVVALGFYQYGFVRGLAALVGFYGLARLIRVVLPKPNGAYFYGFVLRSMIRRHADYLRDGDQVRAGAMADLLERAGVPIRDFIHPFRAPRRTS